MFGSKKIKDSFTVYAAKHEDIANCSAWVQHKDITLFETRSIVKITNLETDKSVRCELYKADRNFRTYYGNSDTTIPITENIDAIVLNYYYREKLGIENTFDTPALSIQKSAPLVGVIGLNLSHPQTIVRLATWLGIISVVLGLIGVVLGILPWVITL